MVYRELESRLSLIQLSILVTKGLIATKCKILIWQWADVLRLFNPKYINYCSEKIGSEAIIIIIDLFKVSVIAISHNTVGQKIVNKHDHNRNQNMRIADNIR